MLGDRSWARRLGRGDQISPMIAVEIAGLLEIPFDRIFPPTHGRRFGWTTRHGWWPRYPDDVRIDLRVHAIRKNIGPHARGADSNVRRPVVSIEKPLGHAVRGERVIPPTRC